MSTDTGTIGTGLFKDMAHIQFEQTISHQCGVTMNDRDLDLDPLWPDGANRRQRRRGDGA